jgi:hypothetical protein
MIAAILHKRPGLATISLKVDHICIISIKLGGNLQKIENYCQKHILKSGIKPVATKLYGNDAYMIHFQTYGC